MSEYTSYAVVHVDDLMLVRNELSRNNITSVFLLGFNHPLYHLENSEKKWKSLSFRNQWVILMAKGCDCNSFNYLPTSIYLMIDENMERWSLRLHKNGEKKEYLFSDTPWGDMCALDPKDDWERIENANTIGDADLKFMEELFKVEHSEFAQYLKMGPNIVWNFLEIVGLPAIEMLSDWGFSFPEEGNNRCMLWDEYNNLVD
jgi:hypothetical protein